MASRTDGRGLMHSFDDSGNFVETSMIGDEVLRILISGRIDVLCQRRFENAFRDIPDPTGIHRYEVDLGAVEYIDSMGLGMLLTLRHHAKEHGATVRLMNCTPHVSRVLQLANFSRLFQIG